MNPPPPWGTALISFGGGGLNEPPPIHLENVITVGKRLDEITCDFFLNVGK